MNFDEEIEVLAPKNHGRAEEVEALSPKGSGIQIKYRKQYEDSTRFVPTERVHTERFCFALICFLILIFSTRHGDTPLAEENQGSTYDFMHSEPNSHPIYLYLAGIEGSGHHTIEPVIKSFMNATGMYQWRLNDGEYTHPSLGQSKKEREGLMNDNWILQLIEEFREWNGEGLIPMYIMGAHGSFPAYITDERKRFVEKFDPENPTQTLETLLQVLQQKRQPASLLQHASFGRNILRTTYDFKVVWIQRDFVSAVYSRWKDWKLDGHFRKHTLMMAINELYIATELMYIEASGLGNCVKIHTNLLNNPTGQAGALRNISRLLNIEVPVCDTCFGKYRPSKKHPREALSEAKVAYVEQITAYIDGFKTKFNICNG